MGLQRVRQHLVIKKTTTTDSLETFLFIASPNHPTLLFSTDLLLLLLLNCSFHTWLVDSGEVIFLDLGCIMESIQNMFPALFPLCGVLYHLQVFLMVNRRLNVRVRPHQH